MGLLEWSGVCACYRHVISGNGLPGLEGMLSLAVLSHGLPGIEGMLSLAVLSHGLPGLEGMLSLAVLSHGLSHRPSPMM